MLLIFISRVIRLQYHWMYLMFDIKKILRRTATPLEFVFNPALIHSCFHTLFM